MTTHRDVAKALHNSGWELEQLPSGFYIATQGNYRTRVWNTPEQVLADVRRMLEPDPHQGRNEDDFREDR